MSLYNILNGVNPLTFSVLPMLGRHPDTYPRFRDCFVADEEHPEYDGHIHVYTRVGGNNRGEGYGEEQLYADPNYVTTFDDSFDNTFATYVFRVPEKWQEDFDRIMDGGLENVSEEYQRQVRGVFPKLKSKLDELWPATAETMPDQEAENRS